MVIVNGRKIRALREADGLSTTELAERVASSQATISKVETGAKAPSVALLVRIADFFGLTVDDFIERASA